MPIKKSAIKALRQSKKKANANLKVKKQVKDLVKKTKALIEQKEKDAAAKAKEAIKAIDKAVQKKILKKSRQLLAPRLK